MKKRTNYFIAIFVLFAGLFIFVILPLMTTPLFQILTNKIVLYGKVLDQNDDPVAHAVVRYAALDLFGFARAWDEGVPKKTVIADEDGRFKIRGRGGSLNVYISKDGYYSGTESSNESFTYGMPSGELPATDPDKPAIFRLHKKGKIEPLIFVPGRFKKVFDLSGKKNPAVIDLETADRVRPVGTWSNRQAILEYRQNNDSENREWELEVSVKEGGIVERTGRFDFLAPEDGYQKSIIITSENELAKGHVHARAGTDKHFFAKFPDGTYGRFVIGLFSRDDPYFTLASWINPSGSRNLEDGEEQPITGKKQ